MQLIKASDVRQLVKPDLLVNFIKQQLSHKPKSVTEPKRTLMFYDEPFSVFGCMPIWDQESKLFVVKSAAFVKGTNHTSVNAMTNVYNTETGAPIALIDGASMTAYRTAAVSAAITDVCATENAKSVAVLGAGIQAWHHIVMLKVVRNIEQISIFSRGNDNIKRLTKKIKCHMPDITVVVENSAAECVKNKDIVIAATSQGDPLFTTSDLKTHTHVNLIGGHSTKAREMGYIDMFNHIVITENRVFAIEEAGAEHKHCLEPDDIFHLSPEKLHQQITIFSSIGTALMDLYFVKYLLSQSVNADIPILALND